MNNSPSQHSAVAESVADFSEFLRNELRRRQTSNPRYSLRAFARHLQLQSSFLSKILRGERGVTPAFIDRISPKLGLDSARRAEFKAGTEILGHGGKAPASHNFKILSCEMFSTISQWYHYALLELTKVKGFRNSTVWIAKELGITQAEAAGAIERLQLLGMLETTADGKLVCTGKFSNAASKTVVSEAQKSLQKGILGLATEAMDKFPLSARDQSSTTIACPEELLPEVKERIKVFRRELAAFINQAASAPERVYHLSVSFYPVSGTESIAMKEEK